MNIDARLAILERLLEDTTSDHHDHVGAAQYGRRLGEGRQLVDDLDQAQMLKAAAYLSPSRYPGA